MRVKQPLLIIAVIIILFSISGCYYHNAEDEYPPTNIPCDTTAVSYGTDIVGILSANCYVCHGGSAANGSGIKLDTYAGVSAQANFGPLLQVIEHQPGFPAMPKDRDQLSACDIATIRTWIRNGAPNN